MLADEHEHKEEFTSSFIDTHGDLSVRFIDNDTLQLEDKTFIRVR